MADITGTHELGPGITPYPGFFGALKLKNEVVIEFDVTVEVKNEEPRNGGG